MKINHSMPQKLWLNKLFQAFHVDELSLDYELHSIFTSLPRFQSLKVLKLIISPQVPVKLPEMKWIETQDSVGVWVSQSFPSLKSLLLSRVHMWLVSTKQLDLTIQSSCLEDLTICYCCSFNPVRIITLNLRALSYTNCIGQHCSHNMSKKDEIVVEVSAPNLQSLMWDGAPRRLCYDEKIFKNLHVTIIANLRFHNLNLAKQLLEAARWTVILRIDSDTLQNLYEKALIISFGNVRHLEIQVESRFCEDIVCDVLTTCLERISNLETLTLAPSDSDDRAPYYPFSFTDVLKECRKTKWKKIKGLKKVKFRIRNMYHAMAYLIGMMKKSCMDMEEMTLIYPSCYDKSIKLYLNCLKSASSSLSINLSTTNRKRCRSQYNSLDSLKKPSQYNSHSEKITTSSAQASFGASSKKVRLTEDNQAHIGLLGHMGPLFVEEKQFDDRLSWKHY